MYRNDDVDQCFAIAGAIVELFKPIQLLTTKRWRRFKTGDPDLLRHNTQGGEGGYWPEKQMVVTVSAVHCFQSDERIH